MPVVLTNRKPMAIHFCDLFSIVEVSNLNLLCRQSERYVTRWCPWMWRGSICGGCVADRNEQIRSSVDLIHHWRAAHSGRAAERRRPEHLAGVGVVGVDRAVAAETEKQTAGSDDDAVSHLGHSGTVDALGS